MRSNFTNSLGMHQGQHYVCKRRPKEPMQSIALRNASDVLVICNILNWKPILQPSKDNAPLPASGHPSFFASLPISVEHFYTKNCRKQKGGSASQAHLSCDFVSITKQSQTFCLCSSVQ